MICRLMKISITAACLLAVAGGCDDNESFEYEQLDAEGGITPIDVDGVWVFSHPPNISYLALTSGEAKIANGCLMVDHCVVVWHSDMMDEVLDLMGLVSLGLRPKVTVGGGGDCLEEGGSNFTVPSAINKRCPSVTCIWYAGMDSLTINP